MLGTQVRLLYHMYAESDAGLSLRSFELFLRRANLHLGASEAASLFEKADRDRNGAVCLTEFALFAEENPELVAGAIATLRQSVSADQYCHCSQRHASQVSDLVPWVTSHECPATP